MSSPTSSSRQPAATSPRRGTAGPGIPEAPVPRWTAIYEYQMRLYRRIWKGSMFSRFLMPLLFLLSMGLGLGSLVDRSNGGISVGGQVVPYLLFVVPAILAVQAMGTGMGESSWPVLGAIRWSGTYHAMLATPAGVADILKAHCAYVATQVGLASAVFLVVATGFGGLESWSALWLLPISVLLGLGFTTLMTAFSAHQENDGGFNLVFRLGQTPMMLFSGTFFPISQLPVWLQPLAWATPLWHGVEANRAIVLGTGSLLGVAGHLLALAAFAALGWWLALISLRKRLVV